MENKGKYYITTAIPYASQKPHFGNTYEVIMTDAVARFRRMEGYDVYFCTGTDEHGKKIEDYASAAGMSPRAYADKISGEIRRIWDMMGAQYDRFIRTTDEDHVKAVQTIFTRFYENGDIYKGYYEGWYCEPDESFYTDTQLIDGKCPDCGREVKQAREEAYFFKMSKYAPRLIEYINEHPGFIEPEGRKKEMLNNFLIPGLQDLCVSRSSFKWGVPLPFDDKHVSYVWIDALSNYITALGYRADLEKQPELFTKYWPCDVHVIGKDILRFHTIYWPIFLMALGLPLPEKVFGHPWFNTGADKMSKSRGNVIYADELAEKLGVDAVRYYALAEMPYATDGSITYENVILRYNTDLANTYGNLVSRTLAMTQKYFGGVNPGRGDSAGADRELTDTAAEAFRKYVSDMESFHIADAAADIFTLLHRANKFIDETSPWVLAKDEAEKPRLAAVIYDLLESIRIASVMLLPMIPGTAARVLDLIGADEASRTLESAAVFGGLSEGEKTGESEVLFARADADKFIEEMDALHPAVKTPEKPEAIPEITYDSFMGTELRSALVLECEKVPKAKKLLKLCLDLGYEKRQVVSGIAAFYKPEELVGKKVIVVANLKPVKLCGEESCGMILASGEEQVRVVFLADDTPLGERIR